MSDIYLSPTSVIRYETCPRQQDFYRQGWRSAGLSDTMHFGNVAHKAVEAFHRAEPFGRTDEVDLPEIFEQAFLEPLETHSITYGANRDKESLIATGRALMAQFPASWKASGLRVATDGAGPLVERKYRVRIKQAGVVLVAKIDVAALNAEARVVLIDNKTPGQEHDSEFTPIMDQLLAYQVIFEAHAHQHGHQRIGGLGIHPLIRRKVATTARGKGPVVQPPDLVERRADADVQEYLAKVADIASDMRNGRFPKRPGHEHNTPCALCEYRAACQHGDLTDLVNVKSPPRPHDGDLQRVAA